MKHRVRQMLAGLLLAALCLGLSACASSEVQAPPDSVSLWLVEGSAQAEALEKLTEKYNTSFRRGGMLPVQVRSFPDEEALGAAFETARPDLLLCAHERAFALYGRGVRQDISHLLTDRDARYAESLELFSPSVGRAYFPIGFETQLLYARNDAADAAGGDMPALLARAARYGTKEQQPFLTADSFSDLLYSMLLSQDTELHGDRREDSLDQHYVSAYNLLAEAAFAGGLTGYDLPAVALVEGGRVPCAAADCVSLLGADWESFTVSPLPRSREGDSYLAHAMGLAVTARESRDLRPIAGFISWLLRENRLGKLALDSALVPAVDYEGLEARDALQSVLLEAAAWDVQLPGPYADFTRNRDSLEQELRAAFQRLN